jgi:asparaginyl-tRNA synthetase
LQAPEKYLSIEEVFQAPAQKLVNLRGWISTRSDVGNLLFATLRDGTGYVQVAGKRGSTQDEAIEEMKKASVESSVSLSGVVRDDKRAPGGKEVLVSSFRIVALADTWPITKTAVRSRSFLYDNRHLSIRGRKSIAIMRIRAQIIHAAFDFFLKNGFTLISAPTLVQSASEGGSTLFSLDYFGKEAFLTQSSQLYEEAAICSFEKVFIFQPAFRAEKSRTSKHLTEFWMIEAEQAFASQRDNLGLQERFLSAVLESVIENNRAELETLERRFTLPSSPYPQISYDDVWKVASEKGLTFEWGNDLPTEVERMISLDMESPFFITDYPAASRGFYHMLKEEDEKLTLSADLLAPEGFGEIATGGQRIHDFKLLNKRVDDQDLPSESFQWYMDLRKYGLPPHSGFGIGVERTVRWICGLKNIRAASLFPRTTTRISP